MRADLNPVAASERVTHFDALRGFALLGILLVNFWGSAGTAMPAVDQFVSGLLDALVSSSFYPLYSFLFGLGFAVQLARAKQRGTGATHLYLRRMAVLLLIGTAHAVLIWNGDILVPYAITGLLLIPLSRIPQKPLLVLALVLFALQMNSQAVRTQVNTFRAGGSAQIASLRLAAEQESDRLANNHRLLAGEGDASYAVATTLRWKQYAARMRARASVLNFLLDDVLLYFIIGLLVGRARVLHEAAQRPRPLLITMGAAFAAGLTGYLSLRLLQLPARSFTSSLAWFAANIGVTAFYICAISLLLTRTQRGRKVLGVFVAPGRMGLTNYLSQSLVMTWLTASYGLGWQLSTTVWVLVNLVFFFGVQVPLSRWWMARFQYGPAEWLWRSLTYGAAQPLRLAAPPALAPVAAV